MCLASSDLNRIRFLSVFFDCISGVQCSLGSLQLLLDLHGFCLPVSLSGSFGGPSFDVCCLNGVIVEFSGRFGSFWDIMRNVLQTDFNSKTDELDIRTYNFLFIPGLGVNLNGFLKILHLHIRQIPPIIRLYLQIIRC